MASFSLTDPTNFATNGLSVTLFSKTDKVFPNPDPGDILMLRNMMVRLQYRGRASNTKSTSSQGDSYGAVGASFKSWQWAVFHVKTGKVSTAPPNTARQIKADTIELQRSLRLGDWWRDVESSAMSFGGGPASLIPAKRGRQHKLISAVEPNEYFDCTVEVSSPVRVQRRVLIA